MRLEWEHWVLLVDPLLNFLQIKVEGLGGDRVQGARGLCRELEVRVEGSYHVVLRVGQASELRKLMSLLRELLAAAVDRERLLSQVPE